MNYGNLPPKILKKVLRLVGLINNIEVLPEVRQLNMERLLKTVGQATYNKIYEMNAWDMEIPHTTGKGIDTRYYGLAKISAGAPVTNTELEDLILNYLQNMGGLGQQDAMELAKESGKYPRVKRSIVGETCSWCVALAGEYIDPPSDVFARHVDCDCSIITSGYKSRNGLLQNYKKSKK